MTQHTDTQVLIVGAGPTGLMLAICLRLKGINVRLIERNAQAAPVSKALGVWSASLEALDAVGAIEAFQSSGVRLHSLVVGDGPKQLGALAVGDGIDSRYPYPLLLAQSRSEAILARRLAELGGTIERSTELVGMAQDAEGVTATVKHGDGREEQIRALYLVGTDGARSYVRHALDIEFEGYTEPQTFILGDVKIDGGDLDTRSLYIWWGKGGSVAMFPYEEGVWRLFGARADADDQSEPTLAELQEYMDRHGPPGTRLRDPSWLSVFHTNERLAATYRVGRVLIGGDAAHIHSPAGGQGMNTGLQDAFNLGWKLAYVLEGRGDAELLLESYGAERRPVAHDVVKASAQKLHGVFTKGRIAEVLRNVAVTIAGNVPAIQQKLQVDLSETMVRYEGGPLVALGHPPSHHHRSDVGTRALEATLRDPSGAEVSLWSLINGFTHTLLLFPDASGTMALGTMAQGLDDALKVVVIDPASDPQNKVRERYRISGAGWVLVRPDLVIAARGPASDLSTLANYVESVLRPASPL